MISRSIFSIIVLALATAVCAGCDKFETAGSETKAPPPGAQSAAQATEAPKVQEPKPAIAPKGPIRVRRVHRKGQTYTLRFSRSDEKLSVDWLGTAEVLDTSDDIVSLGIHILSITSEFPGKAPKKSSTNIRVRVEIQDGSHDARIISSDSNLLEATDLTAFEMMAGDFCQPPEDAHEANSEWQSDETRKHTFAGITANGELQVLRYLHEHRSEFMDMDCEASIAIDDGYAGKRDMTTTLKLGKGLPPSTQEQSLTIRRL